MEPMVVMAARAAQKVGKSFIMRDGSFAMKHIDLPFYRGTFFRPIGALTVPHPL